MVTTVAALRRHSGADGIQILRNRFGIRVGARGSETPVGGGPGRGALVELSGVLGGARSCCPRRTSTYGAGLASSCYHLMSPPRCAGGVAMRDPKAEGRPLSRRRVSPLKGSERSALRGQTGLPMMKSGLLQALVAKKGTRTSIRGDRRVNYGRGVRCSPPFTRWNPNLSVN